MKKTVSTLALAGIVALSSCGEKKSEQGADMVTDTVAKEQVDNTEVAIDTINQEEMDANVMVTVKGKVTHIVPGKDGYMAEIQDDSGKTYFTTISIPNMDDPKDYKQVNIGDVITVKGESWKMDDELHIKVTELK